MTQPGLRVRRSELARQLVGPFLGVRGGLDPRGARFGGRLADSELTPDEYSEIYHSLIFRNGVRKTTAPGRNLPAIEMLLRSGRLQLPPTATVLDIGSSNGVDALSTYRRLQRETKIASYVLGDLFTEILIDPQRRYVYDQDGTLMQRRVGFGFVNRFFCCQTRYQRWAALPQRALAWVLTRPSRHPRNNLQRCELIHPELRNETGAPFSIRRLDVFEPIGDASFDLIICLHLLMRRYFEADMIEAGVRNLQHALKIGGTLVTGAAESLRVITRVADAEYRTEVVAGDAIATRNP